MVLARCGRGSLYFAFVVALLFPGIAKGQNVSTLTYPANGIASVQPLVVFQWTPTSTATAYYLYVGTSYRSTDTVNTGEIQLTSVAAKLLPGTKYFATIWTKTASGWFASDSTFTTDTGSAAIVYPTTHTQDFHTDDAIGWSTVPDAIAYRLTIDTVSGGSAVFDSGVIPGSSIYVPGLLEGVQYYARIWTQKSSGWTYQDSTFTAVAFGAGPAHMLAPPDGAGNVVGSTGLAWTAVPNVQSYRIAIGTTLGRADVFDTGSTASSSVSLPQRLGAGEYFVRLYTQQNGTWSYVDSTFSVGVAASVLSPMNGATGVNPLAPIRWTSFPGAQEYYLFVGTAPGLGDIYNSGEILVTQEFVGGLASGQKYFLRLETLVNGMWLYSDSSFTVGAPTAYLFQPADKSVGFDPYQPFTWNSVPGAQAYFLWVGTQPGLHDVYSSGETQQNYLYPSGLQAGQKYYVRLLTEINGLWSYSDSTFISGTGIATLISPPDRSTNISPFVPFAWTTVATAQAYYLYVGTSVGANDVYDGGETLVSSAFVPGLVVGTKYYARLWTKRNGWKYVDSTFTAGSGLATLLQPVDGSANVDTWKAVQWTAAPNATAYYLKVGTTEGANDIYDSGELSRQWVYLPVVPAGTYYATLLTQVAGTWHAVQSTFQAGPAIAYLTNPSNGTAGVDPLSTFTWAAPVSGADAYYLDIGTGTGLSDAFDSAETTSTNIRPTGLLYGMTYYARLWTRRGSNWLYSDSSFQTSQQQLDTASAAQVAFYNQVNTLTANVRGMADPASGLAYSGTPLALDVSVTTGDPTQNQATCVNFSRVLANELEDSGIIARLRYVTLDGTTSESHTLVEYWDPYAVKWSVADATFGAVYYDPTGRGRSVEELNALLISGQVIAMQPQWVTSSGDGFMRAYYMDPVTLFNNYYPEGGYQPTGNSPLPYLQAQDLATSIGLPGTYVVLFASPDDSASVITSPNNWILTPNNGTLWSNAFPGMSGWAFGSLSSGTSLYSFVRVLY